jgi:exosortase/archaeosortase family protein
VQGLQQFNAWLVAHVLVIGGVYAQASGNVIILTNCTLGVEAACSGIRSLQAALMVAFLVGEFYRFDWPRRGKLVLLAIGLALLGNFSRALFLSILAASYGVNVMSQWHDTAGLSILIFTSVTTWLVAAFLQKRDPQFIHIFGTPPSSSSPRSGLAQRLALGILFSVILGTGITQAWYTWRESSGAKYPTWTASLPTTGKFKSVPIPEESHAILQYDIGHEVQWKDDQNWDWINYWFFYHPKAAGESVFQVHNPDICLPAAGLAKIADYSTFVAQANGIRLLVSPKEFSYKGMPIYVFWVIYANRSTFPMEKALTLSDVSLVTKARYYLSNVWHGRRASNSEIESLETVIAGPADYTAAHAAYLAELQKIVVPDPGQLVSSQ